MDINRLQRPHVSDYAATSQKMHYLYKTNLSNQLQHYHIHFVMTSQSL